MIAEGHSAPHAEPSAARRRASESSERKHTSIHGYVIHGKQHGNLFLLETSFESREQTHICDMIRIKRKQAHNKNVLGGAARSPAPSVLQPMSSTWHRVDRCRFWSPAARRVSEQGRLLHPDSNNANNAMITQTRDRHKNQQTTKS